MKCETDLKTDFENNGFVLQKNIVPLSWIDELRCSMISIMQPYCECQKNGVCDASYLDELFLEVSALSQRAKSNVYSTFGRLANLPLILSIPSIHQVVHSLGFNGCTIQAYSIFCLEPGNDKHKFLPHQDLKGRTSLKSLLLWVPLTAGNEFGGMACWPGSHTNGPLVHGVTPRGQLELPEKAYANYEREDLSDYEIGDAFFMNPYLVHETIGNRGKGIRWTAIIKIDDILCNTHLAESLNPFCIEDFIDTKNNAERLQLS